MPITLGLNIASIQSIRRLAQAEDQLGSVFERLSSGQRINRSSDDAAGLAIAADLNVDRRVYNQGVRNLNDGLSVLNIADATVEELSSIIIRIQELATQAANGSLSNDQREALDLEAQELRDEFFRISRSANFNDLQLFDGSLSEGILFQAGYGLDGSILGSLGGSLGDGTIELSGTIGVGGSPFSNVVGDLNGDGFLDIVAGNEGDGTLSVLLGNGDGSFGSPSTITAGTGVRAVELGDFNGDGILDLVTANQNDNELSVLLGNGDGTFQQELSVGVGADPESIALGDLNGDGALDIVAGNHGDNSLSIVLGNGNGTFQSAQSISTGGGPSSPRSVDLGDVDGDGALDILVGDPGDDTVALLLGNGDGSFQTEQDIYVAGNLPRDAEFGDFNNDGVLDIGVVNRGDGTFSVLLGNGDGTFQSAQDTTIGSLPSNVEYGDMNGDGHLDVVVSNTNDDTISVLLGNGDGTFQTSDTVNTGNQPTGLNLGDFDGDGVLDVVASDYADDQIGIYLGGTREGIAPILPFSLATQADALQALGPLEQKLSLLTEQRSTIGSLQSRLESATRTLQATAENYASAESRIIDADIAQETANMVRLQILRESSAAVLSQANQQPALVLDLLNQTR